MRGWDMQFCCWGGRNRCWGPGRGSHLLGEAQPVPGAQPVLFSAGQAAGTGIPSRCRCDVGVNTWKGWASPEGLCDSSWATPPRSHTPPVPGSSPTRDFWCVAMPKAASRRWEQLPCMGRSHFPQPCRRQHCPAQICIHMSASWAPAPSGFSHELAISPQCLCAAALPALPRS